LVDQVAKFGKKFFINQPYFLELDASIDCAVRIEVSLLHSCFARTFLITFLCDLVHLPVAQAFVEVPICYSLALKYIS